MKFPADSKSTRASVTKDIVAVGTVTGILSVEETDEYC